MWRGSLGLNLYLTALRREYELTRFNSTSIALNSTPSVMWRRRWFRTDAVGTMEAWLVLQNCEGHRSLIRCGVRVPCTVKTASQNSHLILLSLLLLNTSSVQSIKSRLSVCLSVECHAVGILFHTLDLQSNARCNRRRRRMA